MTSVRRAGPPTILLTCEHAGRSVPGRWLGLFEGAEDVLASHRGWDPGAFELACRLAELLEVPLIAHHVTRLLVDVNRSPDHPRLFSQYTRRLDARERALLVAREYTPHRDAVKRAVRDGIEASGSVLQVGVHSFVPVLANQVRDVDLGILYDPGRWPERAFARSWLQAARTRLPDVRILANRPYRGVSDGLTTALRRSVPAARYSGLELEVGQSLLAMGGTDSLAEALAEGLHEAVEGGRRAPVRQGNSGSRPQSTQPEGLRRSGS